MPLVDISGVAHLLFTRRSLSLSSHSGQVSFPGGKQDPEDEDLTRTALRNIHLSHDDDMMEWVGWIVNTRKHTQTYRTVRFFVTLIRCWGRCEKFTRETEEELGIPSSEVEVWCQMPDLSSNRKGDYSATPVVGYIRNFDKLKLRISQGEVSSVFTGNYCGNSWTQSLRSQQSCKQTIGKVFTIIEKAPTTRAFSLLKAPSWLA